MNTAEFNEGRKKFTLYLLPGVFGFLMGLSLVLSILMPDKPHPQRSLPVQSLCVLAGIMALGFGFYWFRKGFAQLRRLECPGCKELMTRHVNQVLRTGRCPVCGERILSDVYEESFQPANSKWPKLQAQSPDALRRQKMLGAILFLLGFMSTAGAMLFVLADKRLYAMPLALAGIIFCAIGLFVRVRARQRIPVFAVTDLDKAEFKKWRHEFAIRNLLARFLGTFAGLLLFTGIYSIFYSDAGKSRWQATVVLLSVGVLFGYCAKLLFKKPE